MKNITIYKIYNFLQVLYTLYHYHFANGKALPPLRYNINLTFHCNLKCPFCYIGNQVKCEELDTESWLKFIDSVHPFSLISYSGGEVTLQPDFKIILKRSLQRAKVTFLTNGTYMDDELLDIIIKDKLFLLGVSIDGIGDNHDRIRGLPGTFTKAVQLIQTVQARKNRQRNPLIDIKTVILNENLDELVDIYKLADSLKVNVFTLSFLKGCNLQFNPVLEETFSEKFYLQEHPIEQYFDMEKFKHIYRELLHFSRQTNTQFRFYPEFASKRGEKELQRIEYFYKNNSRQKTKDLYYKCLYPWTELSLISNGDCYPCLAYRIGNIKNETAAQLWNNPKYIAFRQHLIKEGVFNSCQGCCYSRLK